MNWRDVCPYCQKEICVTDCRGLYIPRNENENRKHYSCNLCNELDENEDRFKLARHLDVVHDCQMVEYIFDETESLSDGYVRDKYTGSKIIVRDKYQGISP